MKNFNDALVLYALYIDYDSRHAEKMVYILPDVEILSQFSLRSLIKHQAENLGIDLKNDFLMPSFHLSKNQT